MTEYENQSSQRERRDLLVEHLRAKQQQGSTYSDHTRPELEIGGRYRQSDLAKNYTVGSDLVPQYPQGPEWSSVRGPDEPPLGWSVEEQQTTGESFEVEASLSRGSAADRNANDPSLHQERGAAPASPRSTLSTGKAPLVGAARSGAVSSPSTVRSASPTPTTFRRRI